MIRKKSTNGIVDGNKNIIEMNSLTFYFFSALLFLLAFVSVYFWGKSNG